MQLDLDRAQVALGNTTNRLMSLQHSQFVENRVYDDEETLPNATSTVNSTSTVEKPNLVDALQYALNSGIKMLDKYYEKVTFEMSDDSEDDEVDEAGQSSKRYFDRSDVKAYVLLACLFQHYFPSERSIPKSSVATFDRFEGLAGKVAHRLGRFGCGRWL